MADLFDNGGKRCACCGRVKERSQFNGSRTSSDGLQSYCRECQRDYHRRHPRKEWKRGSGGAKAPSLWGSDGDGSRDVP